MSWKRVKGKGALEQVSVPEVMCSGTQKVWLCSQ